MVTTPFDEKIVTQKFNERIVQPIADRVAKIMKLFLKTFNLLPNEPRFSWDLSLVPGYYYLELIVNPMGRILVR